MSFRLEFRPQVSADVFAAAAWYDEQESGLGAEFAFAALKRLDELLQNPLLPRLRDRVRGVRWVYPHRFPYRIISGQWANGSRHRGGPRGTARPTLEERV